MSTSSDTFLAYAYWQGHCYLSPRRDEAVREWGLIRGLIRRGLLIRVWSGPMPGILGPGAMVGIWPARRRPVFS